MSKSLYLLIMTIVTIEPINFMRKNDLGYNQATIFFWYICLKFELKRLIEGFVSLTTIATDSP